MTTNQSSTNAFAYAFKTGLKGLPLLPAIANFCILAFCSLFLSGSQLLSRQPIYNSQNEIEGYITAKERFLAIFFPEAEYYIPVILILTALCSLAMAICSFNFITSKKMVNVYYSLGITRTKLFLGKYLSGALLLVISVFVPLLIILIFNLSVLGFSGIIFKIFFLYLLSFTVVSLASYTISAAVFSCVGTIFESGIFSSIILFISDIILYGIQTIMGKSLYGNPYGFEFIPVNNNVYDNAYTATLSEQFDFLSPVFFAKAELAKFGVVVKTGDAPTKQVIENPVFSNIFLWIVLTALIAVLAIFLFNKRKAEIAGFIGTNRVLNTVTSFLAGGFAFAFCISLSKTLTLGIIAGLICFSIIHLGLELAVLRDLKKFTKGLYKLPVGLVAVSLFVVSMNTGFFGFSGKIPDKDDIKSVSVTIVGEASGYGLFGAGDHYIIDSNLQYINSSRVLANELTSEKDIETVMKAHKTLIDSQEEDRTILNEIQFSYTLKNGKIFKRNFSAVTPAAYKAILYIEESEYFKNSLETLFKAPIKFPDPKNGIELSQEEQTLAQAQFSLRDSLSSVSVHSKFLDSYAMVSLSDKDREKLLSALYNDLYNRSVTDKYYPDDSPVCFMRFEGDYYSAYWGILESASTGTAETKEEKSKGPKESTFIFQDFSSGFNDVYTSSVYNAYPFFTITSDMAQTIKVLKELKLYSTLTKTPDFVSAKITSAKSCYEGIYKDTDVKRYYSRYFITTYIANPSTMLDEFGNPEDTSYSRFNGTVDQDYEGYTTNDLKDVEKLLRHAFTAYEQDSTDSGYFVTFYTSDGDKSLCFIPENRLPQEFKIKL
ncbi:MAG: hypothetical protein IKC01_07270 [Clostridia bacterium]|nr:hypothetical protein [Clostridia bacterium]